MKQQETVAVIGLGYVGLPVALAFGRTNRTIGYDISEKKVTAYQQGFDPTGEMPTDAFKQATQLVFTMDPAQLQEVDFFIVAVPTPIDEAARPDMTFLIQASRTVGNQMKKGAIVVYESTVYPGVTEEICVGVLEKESGLKCGSGFTVGYSPERINPGDPEHSLEKIVKVVAGQDQKTLEVMTRLYGQITEAGVFPAPSIRVAEAAKVIENTQRDLNIALMNELAIIFNRLAIDTQDVLRVAETKWNFLPFRPGLVGGHCIGVDPYYLTHKAQTVGYHPEVILAGRRINDSMGRYIAQQTVKKLIKARRHDGMPVLVMGLTFKEDCADLRNSKVVDLVRELESFDVEVLVWDPVASPEEARTQYDIDLVGWEALPKLSAIVAAVPHRQVLEVDLDKLAEKSGLGTPFIDVRSQFSRHLLQQAGFEVWRL